MRRIRFASQKKTLRRVKKYFIRITKSRRFRYLRLSFLHKFSTVLIISGIMILLYPMIRDNLFELPESVTTTTNEKTPNAPSFGPIKISDALTKGTRTAQPPSRIVIPGVNIDLSVTESNLVNGYWEVSETTASHGMGSAYPGQVGNTVIFAHARKGLFLPLRDVRIGTVVYILTNDRWHRYRIVQKKDVSPSATEVIEQTDDETLTLFTCTGFLDTKRLVVTAKADR